jgi:hypothetical protein
MVVIAWGVVTSVGVMAGTVAWAWRSGTLFETPQEGHDHEFERITQRLRRLGGRRGDSLLSR